MIPLNKTGYCHTHIEGNYLDSHFTGRYAHILSNAGDGLNIAYRHLYETRGRLRIGVSPLACVLAIYPIIQNGHIPVFIDIDPQTFNMDSRKLLNMEGIDALEVIHLGGNPNEMDVISRWSLENKKIVIEDCAQAMGACYNGLELGNFGDYAAFSLIKNLHVATGGLFLTKDNIEIGSHYQISPFIIAYRELKKYLESHSDCHSLNIWNLLYRQLLLLKEKNGQRISSEVYCLSKKRTAQIIRQLSQIDFLNEQRLRNANDIIQNLDQSKYEVQKELPKAKSNRNRLLLYLKSGLGAEKTICSLRQKGIAANNLTQNYLKGFQQHISKDELLKDFYKRGELDVYDSIHNHIIAIPSSPYLREDEKLYIIETLNTI